MYAFQDYFQMGETTGMDCLKKLARCVSSSEELRSIFLRSMTRADARRVSALHEEKHRVQGMLGSLDCMHAGWKNCPIAWQGAFQGKEGHPTIVLEAFCDYNLWMWHAAFGWAGSMNHPSPIYSSRLSKRETLAFPEGTRCMDGDHQDFQS
jgi:hypothetical protein